MKGTVWATWAPNCYLFRGVHFLSLEKCSQPAHTGWPRVSLSRVPQAPSGEIQEIPSTSVSGSSGLELRRRHVGKQRGSWGQDDFETTEMASFHELAAVVGPEEAASDRLAAARKAQSTASTIKQALTLGRQNPVRKATTRVRWARPCALFSRAKCQLVIKSGVPSWRRSQPPSACVPPSRTISMSPHAPPLRGGCCRLRMQIDTAPKPKHVHKLVLETWHRRRDTDFPMRARPHASCACFELASFQAPSVSLRR